MTELYNNGEIEKEYSLEETPYEIWLKLEIPYPDKPSYSIWLVLISSVIGFILISIPFIWMIKI